MSDMIMPTNPPKSPVVAALLSFFLLGGAGQIYLGQVTKGVVLMVVTFVLYFCFGAGVLLNIIGAIDAYAVADKLQKGTPISQWQWF